MKKSIFDQRLEHNKEKQSSYTSAFWCEDDPELSESVCKLMTAFHATKISMGNQLEDTIASVVENSNKFAYYDKSSTDEFNFSKPGDFYIKRFKFKIEDLEKYNIILKGKKAISIDGLARIGNTIYIVELKDGNGFDTKKSQGEMESLLKCLNYMRNRFGNTYRIETKFVLWNCDNLANSSVKTTTNRESICTGADYCDTIGISKKLVDKGRKKAKQGNIRSFLSHAKQLLGGNNDS